MSRILWMILSLALAGATSGAAIEGQLHVRADLDIRALLRHGDTLWVGTSGGVALVDLSTDRVARRIVMGPSLPSNSVRSLAARNDSIFVGTDGGLAIFTGANTTVLTPSQPDGYRPIPLARIRSIDFGRDGSWYIGTYGDGLGVVCPDSNFTLTRRDSLLDEKVFGVCELDDSTFYFATAMGLCGHRDGAWVGFQAGAGIPRGEVRQLEVGPRDRLYLRVDDSGIYRFDGNVATRLSRDDVFPEDAVAAFVIDARDRLWAAGRYGGIASYGSGSWKSATSDPLVATERWRCAAADEVGGVFFGSANGLIVAIEGNVLRKIRLPGGLWSGNVHSLVTDGSGELFMVSGGVVARMGDKGVIVREPAPAPATDLAVAPDGTVWAATRWGVIRRGDKGYVELPVDVIGDDPAFSAIAFDARGRLWVGSDDGAVYRYDGLLWMRLAARGEVLTGPVTTMVGPEGGVIWAFARSGTARYTGQRWEAFGDTLFGGQPVVDAARVPDGGLVAVTAEAIWRKDGVMSPWRREETETGSRHITALTLDENGVVYVGGDRGVGVVGDGAVQWVGAGQGLAGTKVADLFVDGDRYLWVGFASDGLARIPLANVR